MTEEDVATIIAGIAPLVREHITTAKQRADGLAFEISTLREAVLPRMYEAERRSVELEVRCAALEARVIELEATAAAVRS